MHAAADAATLDAIATELRRDCEVRQLPDGSSEAADAAGSCSASRSPPGLRWACGPKPSNAPGVPAQRPPNIVAVDEDAPAGLLTLSPVVHFVPDTDTDTETETETDTDKAAAFDTQRLGFRVTDVPGGPALSAPGRQR